MEGDGNPYCYVASNPVEGLDPWGLQKKCDPNDAKAICGPDVTSHLRDARTIVQIKFHFMTRSKRRVRTRRRHLRAGGVITGEGDPDKGGAPVYLNAWDIETLAAVWNRNSPVLQPSLARTQPSAVRCGLGQCQNTVEVDGQCFYAGSVNYVIFGTMERLCDASKQKMIALIWLHKTWRGDEIMSRFAIGLRWATMDGPSARTRREATDRSVVLPAQSTVGRRLTSIGIRLVDSIFEISSNRQSRWISPSSTDGLRPSTLGVEPSACPE